MVNSKIRFTIMPVVLILLCACPGAAAETWHLQKGEDWKALSKRGEDGYLLAVAEIKKLINKGQTDAVGEALERLKKEFPEIAGPDLDSFIEAEMLFSEGKFVKAVRSYDKFLNEYPESEFYEAALDREFSIATAFLGGQKRRVLKVFKMKGYAQGQRIMERIVDRAGDKPIGKKAFLAIVESLEKRNKFNEAHRKWSQISTQWPSGQMGKEALLGMARCKHAAYKGPKYDSSSLISAKSYYENFNSQYPKEAKELDIEARLKQIEEQLAYKQFYIGQYYQKTDSKQAANAYYQLVLDNWPQSTASKMVKQAKSEELKNEETKTEKVK